VDVAQKIIPKRKVKEECVWKEMPILQVLNHPSTWFELRLKYHPNFEFDIGGEPFERIVPA